LTNAIHTALLLLLLLQQQMTTTNDNNNSLWEPQKQKLLFLEVNASKGLMKHLLI
jgi:hypothetical protein